MGKGFSLSMHLQEKQFVFDVEILITVQKVMQTLYLVDYLKITWNNSGQIFVCVSVVVASWLRRFFQFDIFYTSISGISNDHTSGNHNMLHCMNYKILMCFHLNFKYVLTITIGVLLSRLVTLTCILA